MPYGYRKYYPSKASLASLRDKREEMIEQIANLTKDLPVHTEQGLRDKISYYEKLVYECRVKIARANKNISEAQSHQGFFGTIFRTDSYKYYSREENNYYRERYEADQKLDEYLSHVDHLKNILDTFVHWQYFLKKVEKYIDIKERAEERKLELRNQAAANKKAVRGIAKSVAAKLQRNVYCPYCGCELDYDEEGAVHLDHIYPVSKGGKSTIKNLVYVCSDCNESKGNKTLSNFIKEYGLDRDEIEEALDELNKDY